MKFTFRQLEYFSAAAEAGSIAAAAERIHISAPSISVAITQLEQQLGVALFIRGHAGLSLTTAGQDVLARSRALLAEARELHDSVASSSAGLKGRIALGCMTTLAPMLLPELVRGFAGAHPGVSVESVEGSQDQLIGQLRRGVVDVAVSYDMHVPQDLQFEPLVALPPLLLMAAGHRLAHRPSIALAEVAADDYILLDLPFSRDYFLSVFQQAGLEPKVALRTTQMDVVRTLVANGMGVSVAVSRPLNEAALDGKPIVSVPLSDPLPPLAIGCLTRRGADSAVLAAFRSHARVAVSDDYIPGMRALEASAGS